MTLAALLAVGVLVGSVLRAPLERLLRVVPDDAFYYLQIARNLVATGRSTADGVSLTNGYHPLWLAVVTSLAAVIPDRELLLRAAIGTSVMLHVVASWLVGARVKQVAGPAWGRTAALCWLLNPVALVIALQAMESTLYIVMLLIVLGLHLRLAATFTAGDLPPRRLLVLYGISLGLTSLARTEGAVVAAIALVWLGVRTWRTSPSPSQSWSQSWSAGIIAAGAALLIVLPWLLFSLWQVGTIQQDNGAMKALWATEVFSGAAGRLRNILATADYFFRYSVRLIAWSTPSMVLTIIPLALAAACIAAQLHRPRGSAARAMRVIIVPAIVVAIVYGMTLVERQIWWLGLPWLTMFLAAMLATIWLARAIPLARRHQRAVRAAVLVVAMLALIPFARGPKTPYVWQADVWRSQMLIEQSIPPDQRIGCFNAGIPLYFGTGRIVALDGLVSHAVTGYWLERRFSDYLRDAQVRFIADARSDLARAERFSRAPVPVEERRTFPLRGLPSGQWVLWAVESTDASTH